MTEELGGLQSTGRKELDTTERLHFHLSLLCIGEGNGNPLQCSCLVLRDPHPLASGWKDQVEQKDLGDRPTSDRERAHV